MWREKENRKENCLTISSGESNPNCTVLTRFSGAREGVAMMDAAAEPVYGKLDVVIAVVVVVASMREDKICDA